MGANRTQLDSRLRLEDAIFTCALACVCESRESRLESNLGERRLLTSVEQDERAARSPVGRGPADAAASLTRFGVHSRVRGRSSLSSPPLIRRSGSENQIWLTGARE